MAGCTATRPERWPDLSAGRLEIARVDRRGRVARAGARPACPAAEHAPSGAGVPRLRAGEGIWPDGSTSLRATTADHRVHAYDTRRERIEVIYDGLAPRSAPLLRVDQLTGSRGGEVFVCETWPPMRSTSE